MSIFKILTGEEPTIFEKIVFLATHHFDNGAYGEYLTKYLIDNKITEYNKTLNNIYIPYFKNTTTETTEIDIILIVEQGIFVIESKNYSGWIFGGAEQYKWTQSLNRNTKTKFYNPIKQNETHIKALSDYLKIDQKFFHSYIVFSERCELKKVPSNTDTFTIVKRNQLLRQLKNDMIHKPKILTMDEIDKIESALIPFTNVSDTVKQQHIKNINKFR